MRIAYDDYADEFAKISLEICAAQVERRINALVRRPCALPPPSHITRRTPFLKEFSSTLPSAPSHCVWGWGVVQKLNEEGTPVEAADVATEGKTSDQVTLESDEFLVDGTQ